LSFKVLHTTLTAVSAVKQMMTVKIMCSSMSRLAFLSTANEKATNFYRHSVHGVH
jgi:hypothetical protein